MPMPIVVRRLISNNDVDLAAYRVRSDTRRGALIKLSLRKPFVPKSLFALPPEVRLNVYEHFFASSEYLIHPCSEDCAEYCGTRRPLYNNTALLRTCKQVYQEAKMVFLAHGEFHLFKVAFHGHYYVPRLPPRKVMAIARLTCWAEVCPRLMSHPSGLNLIGPLHALREVTLNVSWTAEHRRNSHEWRSFVQTRHQFEWIMNVKKATMTGMSFRIVISSNRRVVVLSRRARFTDAKLEEFLELLGLGMKNLVGPVPSNVS